MFDMVSGHKVIYFFKWHSRIYKGISEEKNIIPTIKLKKTLFGEKLNVFVFVFCPA